MLAIASIFIYGAAEMALPLPEESNLDMLRSSQALGRLSALLFPAIGMLIVGAMIAVPRWFPPLSIAFAAYTLSILYVTA